VLIGAGFVLCIIALKPLLALDAFVKADHRRTDPEHLCGDGLCP
jgi:hypothetical protein